MSIALTKTLQTVEYNFKIVTDLVYSASNLSVTKMNVYQSAGHYDDGFVPIIIRHEVITDAATIATVEANKYSNYTVAIDAIEDYLVANVAWYATGVVS